MLKEASSLSHRTSGIDLNYFADPDVEEAPPPPPPLPPSVAILPQTRSQDNDIATRLPTSSEGRQPALHVSSERWPDQQTNKLYGQAQPLANIARWHQDLKASGCISEHPYEHAANMTYPPQHEAVRPMQPATVSQAGQQSGGWVAHEHHFASGRGVESAVQEQMRHYSQNSSWEQQADLAKQQPMQLQHNHSWQVQNDPVEQQQSHLPRHWQEQTTFGTQHPKHPNYLQNAPAQQQEIAFAEHQPNYLPRKYHQQQQSDPGKQQYRQSQDIQSWQQHGSFTEQPANSSYQSTQHPPALQESLSQGSGKGNEPWHHTQAILEARDQAATAQTSGPPLLFGNAATAQPGHIHHPSSSQCYGAQGHECQQLNEEGQQSGQGHYSSNIAYAERQFPYSSQGWRPQAGPPLSPMSQALQPVSLPSKLIIV